MGYKGCKGIDEMPFIVNGRIDADGGVAAFCCENRPLPEIPFSLCPEEDAQCSKRKFTLLKLIDEILSTGQV